MLLACCGVLTAQDHTVTLDMFAFNQEDEGVNLDIGGGNPHINEDFVYIGGRLGVRWKISNVITLRPTMSLAMIEPGRRIDPPDSITNPEAVTDVSTASASATNMTLSMITDIKPEGSDWTLSPGAFFAYQPTYVSRGLDFLLSAELLEGNFIPEVGYSFRWDSITGGNLRVAGIWGGRLSSSSRNGIDKDLHNRFFHSLHFGFTQILSPEWRLNASVQFTRQDGYLNDPNAQVILYNGSTPVRFSDERLPNSRNRVQANLRLKYSPWLGWAFGMDHSAYADDWNILNFALEPNAEGTFGLQDARWKLWYRISYQQGARFKRDEPEERFKFQTDDPDLGTFNTHGGGIYMSFNLPENESPSWILQVSFYGFYRSDKIWGYGGLLGSEFAW